MGAKHMLMNIFSASLFVKQIISITRYKAALQLKRMNWKAEESN